VSLSRYNKTTRFIKGCFLARVVKITMILKSTEQDRQFVRDSLARPFPNLPMQESAPMTLRIMAGSDVDFLYDHLEQVTRALIQGDYQLETASRGVN